MFNPELKIGEIISNTELISKFRCGNMGGMRRSLATDTLVLVSDYTKGLYHDKWIGGVLHYTGMGKRGNMGLYSAQNATLAESGHNGVDVHLFEVIDPGEYIYCGRVELVAEPYTEIQPDEDGVDRTVWMFPVRPVPDNDVRKPAPFVFKDMNDFRKNGKKAEEEWAATHNVAKKKSSGGSVGLKGKVIKHKTYGQGTIMKYDGTIITVKFGKETKTLNYDLCIKKGIIEFL